MPETAMSEVEHYKVLSNAKRILRAMVATHRRRERKILFEILGTIGRGKSTLLEALPSEYAKVAEPVNENPWLSAFYAEMTYMRELHAIGSNSWPARTTPMMECHLLAKRKLALEAAFAKSNLVATDFVRPSIYARVLFQEKIISVLDYECFLDVEKAAEMKDVSRVTLYLKGAGRALRNIATRGRSCEQGITKVYLEALEKSTESEPDFHSFHIVEFDGSGSEWDKLRKLELGIPWRLEDEDKVLERQRENERKH